MNALWPCHSSTPKSASKLSVMVTQGIVPAHPRLQPRDVGLRRARGIDQRRVARVQMREVGRPGRRRANSRCRHAPASRARRARRRRGRRSADGGPRTGRAGSPCRPARRTHRPCPPPSTASAAARRPARRGRGSCAFSLTRSCSRAASHSCGDTIGGVFMACCPLLLVMGRYCQQMSSGGSDKCDGIPTPQLAPAEPARAPANKVRRRA